MDRRRQRAAMVVANNKKEREDDEFASFARSLMRNSMVTGMPQIAGAPSSAQRWLRALVFAVCVVGFVYQSCGFMSLYYKYQTVLDIRVDNPKEVDLPAISVCTGNSIMADKICAPSSPYRQDCYSLRNRTDTDWCFCQPRYCDDENQVKDMWLPSKALEYATRKWTFEQQKDFLQDFEEMVLHCQLEGKRSRECNMSNHLNFAVFYGELSSVTNCHTVGTLIGVPDGVPERDISRSRILFLLRPEAKNYLKDNELVENQIQFHHPKAFVDPYVNGQTVYPGFQTTFWLKKTIKHLLPPPFETNCRDYLSEWRARGGHGPIDQRACITECWANASLQTMGGCLLSPYYHPYISEFPRCSETYSYGEYPNLTQFGEECEKDCRPACYEETYTVQKAESTTTHGACVKGGFHGLVDQSWIVLKFDGMETTVYTYSPKFQVIETFSYLGGYMGMWLGISLVAAFDFLETLLQVCRYPTRHIKGTTPVRGTI